MTRCIESFFKGSLLLSLIGCQNGPVATLSLPRPGGVPVKMAPAQQVSPVERTVFGQLLVPSALLSVQTGGLISNNGGGLISQGAGYRVLQLQQVPVANATVELVDANGSPLRDPAGNVLSAKTNEKGEYVIKGRVPSQNIIVRSTLPDNKGVMQAIAPNDVPDEASNLDLISTLTTAYVLGKFIATQGEQQRVLDRYPGSLEKRTRELARQTFEETRQAIPATLDSATLLLTVEQLRRNSGVFDQQMETVRKTLLLAGQSDLGEGYKATEVAIQGLSHIAEGREGEVVLLSAERGRVRLVTADGNLKTILERGDDTTEKPYRARALPGEVNHRKLAFDKQGRAVFIIKNDLLRLEPDGTLTTLIEGLSTHVGILIDANDRVMVVQDKQVLVWQAQGEATKLCDFEWPTGRGVPERLALDSQGRVVLQYGEGDRLYVLNTVDGTVSALANTSKGMMDARGNRFYTDDGYDGHLWMQRADDDQPIRITTWSQSSRAQGHLLSAFLSSDRKTVFAATSAGTILKIQDGEIIRVAGLAPGQEQQGVATTLSLSEPRIVTTGGNGHVFLLDMGLRQFLRLDQDGTLSTLNLGRFLGAYSFVRVLRADSKGRLYAFVEPNGEIETDRPETNGSDYRQAGIYRIANGQAPQLVFSIASQHLVSFAVDKDDRLVALINARPVPDGQPLERFHLLKIDTSEPSGFSPQLRQVAWNQPPIVTLDQRVEELAATALPLNECDMVCGSEGQVVLLGKGRLQAWYPGRGFSTLAEHRLFDLPRAEQDSDALSALTMSANGVIYGASMGWRDPESDEINEAGIWKWEPESRSLTRVAGVGTANFAGLSVDDSIALACSPVLNAAGDLLFIDRGHRQLRQIPKNRLEGVPVLTPSQASATADPASED